MGYVNVLGHYVPDKDETYQYTDALGHTITSTPESRKTKAERQREQDEMWDIWP